MNITSEVAIIIGALIGGSITLIITFIQQKNLKNRDFTKVAYEMAVKEYETLIEKSNAKFVVPLEAFVTYYLHYLKVVKSKKGEMQFGGVIYSDSADKAARFIMNCNQKKIPLVFLQDVSGFMVGSRSEHGGIIKDGAKMVSAMANSVVPKFTVIIGNSYGAGNYAMCGKAYDPRLIVAWPSAQLAVMSGAAAAKVLLQIEVASLKAKGEEITTEREEELYNNIKNKYDEQISPYYAASRLWTDAIINPTDTRKWISMGVEAANHAPIEKQYNVGIIQT